MAKAKKTKVPKELGRVMRWLESQGFSVYGQAMNLESGQEFPGHRDYDAKGVRRRVDLMDRDKVWRENW